MKMKNKSITEKQLLKMEAELDKMGWVRRECGYWNDPVTNIHCPSTVAFGIADQRRNKKGKTK